MPCTDSAPEFALNPVFEPEIFLVGAVFPLALMMFAKLATSPAPPSPTYRVPFPAEFNAICCGTINVVEEPEIIADGAMLPLAVAALEKIVTFAPELLTIKLPPGSSNSPEGDASEVLAPLMVRLADIGPLGMVLALS